MAFFHAGFANSSVRVARLPGRRRVFSHWFFFLTTMARFPHFARAANTVAWAFVSAILRRECLLWKPEPADVALIWFALVAVACCAFPAHSICVASPPLPHRERSFAFVFCALATTSFLQVLRTQRLPIDSVATPDTQQQLTANAVTFLKGASRERPHDEQLLASRHTGCCHVGREDTCHATDVEVSDDTVSQSLALGNMRCNCKARGQWKLQAGDA